LAADEGIVGFIDEVLKMAHFQWHLAEGCPPKGGKISDLPSG
jgi:hypothetical protein